MPASYVHHRVNCRPRQWAATAAMIAGPGVAALGKAGGSLFGVWRSQIGRPRDELTVLTAWPDRAAAEDAAAGLRTATGGDAGIESEIGRASCRERV